MFLEHMTEARGEAVHVCARILLIATNFLSTLVLHSVLLNIIFNHLHMMAQKCTPVNKMGLISLIDLVMSAKNKCTLK